MTLSVKKEKGVSAPAKSRSVGASVRLGYKLFATSFNAIVRATCLPSLIFSLACAVLGSVCVQVLPAAFVEIGMGGGAWKAFASTNLLPLSLAVVAFVVGGLAELCVYGVGFDLLASHQPTGAIGHPGSFWQLPFRRVWRTLKGVVGCAVPSLVGMALVLGMAWVLRTCSLWAKAPVASCVLVGLCALALALLLLPLAYPFVKYVLASPSVRLLPTMRKGYALGLRRYGYVFVVCVFCGVVSVVASYVLAQPAVILGLASTQSRLGVAYGDAAGMPSYVNALSFAAFALAGLVMVALRLSMLFPLYFMASSIDSEEAEREQYKNNIEQ